MILIGVVAGPGAAWDISLGYASLKPVVNLCFDPGGYERAKLHGLWKMSEFDLGIDCRTSEPGTKPNFSEP